MTQHPPGKLRKQRSESVSADRQKPFSKLREHFGERVISGEALCRQHANTLTWLPCEPPDAVVYPKTTKEVALIVDIARQNHWPVIPFGAGTSLEGQLNAPHGGLSIDLSGMDNVISVNTGDLDCTVEAGVTRATLNTHLRDTGLFFPVDPGTQEATLGGMAATRASGTNAVRYGTMRDNVMAMTVVMADGSIMQTGSRARKSATGYDLTKLLVGSEGTLGIITQLTLKLYGIPGSIIAAVVAFKTLQGACDAVMAAIAQGLGVARIELLDPVQIDVLNAHAGLDLEPSPTLFLEFHGTTAATQEQVAQFEELALETGAQSFKQARTRDERAKLWQARHDAFWAVKEAWPGKSVLVTDVCVPISRLAQCVGETEADLKETGLTAPIVGHVGDGNFHAICLFDADDPDEVRALKGFTQRLAMRAIKMDGTCSGEHGIGQGKMEFMEREHGTSLKVMRALKQALDPQNILNPGKILPDP